VAALAAAKAQEDIVVFRDRAKRVSSRIWHIQYGNRKKGGQVIKIQDLNLRVASA